MAPSKVLLVVEDLKLGGLEKVIASIALGLDRDRFRPEVWCLAKGGSVADDLAEKGIPLHILGMKDYRNPFSIFTLARKIGESGAAILHTHGYFASTFGRLASAISPVPVTVSHVHSTYHGYTKRNLRIERFLSRLTDRIVCISKAVQNFVVETEGISADKTCVIYNGVDQGFAASIRTDIRVERALMGIREDEIAVTVVASLTPIKGHRILLQAFRSALTTGVNGKLLIVGDGPLKSDLQLYAEQLGLSSSVIFTGERRDVLDLLRVSDLFVLPSVEREGLGISLIEAMAAGLPLIGSRLGGIPEVIDDRVNGILVAPGSVAELADAIRVLAGDEVLRERMGRSGRRIYEQKFTLGEMLGHIEELYESLLKIKTHGS